MDVDFTTSSVFKKKIRQMPIRNDVEIANLALGKRNTLGTAIISISSMPQARIPTVLTFTADDHKQRFAAILLLLLV